MPISSSVSKIVARCLRTRVEVQAGYIFGSTVNGVARPGSDLDIAVLLDDTVRPSRYLPYRLRLMSELCAALGRSDVDLVILNEASPLLAHRVLSRGDVVFERSASARVRFQVRAAARYADVIPMYETQIRYLKRSVRAG